MEVLFAASVASTIAHYLVRAFGDNSDDPPSTAPVFFGVVVVLTVGIIWK